MAGWTIGDVARRTGLQPSAIRYYESAGLLSPPRRQNGRRMYDPAILQGLAVIALAREAGFSIAEIRTLMHEFSTDTPASVRWHDLATRKHGEIRRQIERLQAMQAVLDRLLACECPTLQDCGRAVMDVAPMATRLEEA